MLKKVEITGIRENKTPKFLKTQLVEYKREGDKPGTWEMSLFPDTVHILVRNTDMDELLLVQQVRVPARVRGNHVSTIEACAGIIDKYPELANQPSQRASLIAIEEVREELGYSIDVERLEVLPTYISGTGSSGGTCHPFYCEVTNEDFKGQQLEESEDIEIVVIPCKDARKFLTEFTNTDATTRSLVQWFLLNKEQNSHIEIEITENDLEDFHELVHGEGKPFSWQYEDQYNKSINVIFKNEE